MKKGEKPIKPDMVKLDQLLLDIKIKLDDIVPNLEFRVTEIIEFWEKEMEI